MPKLKANIEEIVEALLKAEEEAERKLKEELGGRVKSLDVLISLEVGDQINLDVEVGIGGKGKGDFEGAADRAAEAALNALSKWVEGRIERDREEDQGREVRNTSS